MTILFKDELPLDHEESLEKIVEQWSKDDAEKYSHEDYECTWDDHMDYNWESLEEWVEEEGLDIISTNAYGSTY